MKNIRVEFKDCIVVRWETNVHILIVTTWKLLLLRMFSHFIFYHSIMNMNHSGAVIT